MILIFDVMFGLLKTIFLLDVVSNLKSDLNLPLIS